MTKAKIIECNQIENGGYQLGSSSSLVTSPSWIKRQDTLKPLKEPRATWFVREQPKHTHKTILPRQEHKNAKSATPMPQLKPDEGIFHNTSTLEYQQTWLQGCEL
jgi:hypothetical protein